MEGENSALRCPSYRWQVGIYLTASNGATRP